MRKQLPCSGCSIVGWPSSSGLGACSSSPGQTGGKGGASGKGGSGGSTSGSGGSILPTDAGCNTGIPSSSYVLIDDMETTNHGPIELAAGIASPLTPGYWYNSGANYFPDAGIDQSNPPYMSFAFSALSTPAKTLCGKTSAHAARQSCVLNGLYDTCGVGFEFAQKPDGDAGAPAINAAAGDAGDAGPPIPRTTIPFDISRYKAFTFWGMTTTPDPTTGYLQSRCNSPIRIPTRAARSVTAAAAIPRSATTATLRICTSPPAGNSSRCCWMRAATAAWPRTAASPSIRRGATNEAQWIPTQVYGINWQAQRNIGPGRGPSPHDRHLGRRRVLHRVNRGRARS